MRLSSPANFDMYYCDEKGSLAREGMYTQEKLNGWMTNANKRWTKEARKSVTAIRESAIEKPEWFISAERSARRFMHGLGFEACKGTQVTLIAPQSSEAMQEIFPLNSGAISVDAQHSKYYGIVARKDRLEAIHTLKGKVAVASVLVHELTHAAEWQNPHVTNRYVSANREWYMLSRQGFMTLVDGKAQGQFYAEGIAEFNAGLYARRQQQRGCPITSIRGIPSLELPSHYMDSRAPKDEPYTAGPDGYGMELLAWGVEKKGITSADIFIKTANDTCDVDPSARLKGYRGFAQYTNALSPGLYTDLRELSYGHQAWQDGLARIYDSVVG